MRLASALLIVCASCQAFLDVATTDGAPPPSTNDGGASSDAHPVADADLSADANDAAASPVTVLVANELSPESLATNGKTLFWVTRVEHGTVASCPLTGCGGTPQILASDQPLPYSVAWLNDHLFWSLRNSAELMVRDLSLGTNSVLAGGLMTAANVAVYGGAAFTAYENGGKGNIQSCTAAGCTGSALLYYEDSPVGALAAGPLGLSWLLDGTRLRTCPSGSCYENAIAVAVQDPDGIDAFVADGDGYYYWARHGGTHGLYRNRIGEAPAEIAPGASGITSLAVDQQYVYFASNSTPGGVSKVQRAGGMAPVLVAPAGNPRSLLLNQGFIYWIDGSDGSIRGTAL